ncbi:MAG: hypothetical protein P8Z76_13755 [Alphaproteobacteria bacterium]|jgi:hypothetical protein
MSVGTGSTPVREAVAVFEDAETLQEAIDELLSSGFARADLSLLASEPTVAEKLGHKYEKTSELEDDTAVPRSAYVSTESIGDAQGGLVGGLAYIGAVAAAGAIVASGGTIASAFAAAALAGGAGGMFGTTLAKWVGDHHADALQKQIDKGGLLLWVRTWDEAQEKRARDILSSHSAHDVHIHDLPGQGE